MKSSKPAVPYGGFRTPGVIAKKLFKAEEWEASPIEVRLPVPIVKKEKEGKEEGTMRPSPPRQSSLGP